jgi:hypothetical protein
MTITAEPAMITRAKPGMTIAGMARDHHPG